VGLLLESAGLSKGDDSVFLTMDEKEPALDMREVVDGRQFVEC